MDTHKRTIVKTITWRIIATLTTVLTIYFWTNDWSLALGSGLVANALKTIFYYIHERAWNLTDFGRLPVDIKTLHRSAHKQRE
ncbi:MAG: DUF2061 domain-containing protein [Candidatus Aenigmarchaeota archaeon]|nr:DUF2061 domain-containing protein [Candidatus Aenigmarchaeota archaeon]